MKRLIIYMLPIFFIAACCDKENGTPCEKGREVINDSCQCPPGTWASSDGYPCRELSDSDYFIDSTDCDCFQQIKFTLNEEGEDPFGNKAIGYSINFSGGGNRSSSLLISRGTTHDTLIDFSFDHDQYGDMCLKPATGGTKIVLLREKLTGNMACTITTYEDWQYLKPVESCKFWMSNKD